MQKTGYFLSKHFSVGSKNRPKKAVTEKNTTRKVSNPLTVGGRGARVVMWAKKCLQVVSNPRPVKNACYVASLRMETATCFFAPQTELFKNVSSKDPAHFVLSNWLTDKPNFLNLSLLRSPHTLFCLIDSLLKPNFLRMSLLRAALYLIVWDAKPKKRGKQWHI